MMLDTYIILFLLLSTTIIVLVLPLWLYKSKKTHASTAYSEDKEIYKHNLTQLEQEYTANLITEDVYKQQRAEHARRLLHIDGQAPQQYYIMGKKPILLLTSLIMLSIIAISIAVYYHKGGFIIQSFINQQHNITPAQVQLQDNIKLNPNDEHLWLQLAYIYTQKLQLYEAHETIQYVLSLNPNNSDALLLLVQVQQQLNANYEKINATFERILAITPNHIPSLFQYAMLALTHAKNPSIIQERFDVVLPLMEADPKNAELVGQIRQMLSNIENVIQKIKNNNLPFAQ